MHCTIHIPLYVDYWFTYPSQIRSWLYPDQLYPMMFSSLQLSSSFLAPNIFSSMFISLIPILLQYPAVLKQARINTNEEK
jgi:hypothetical protein